MPAAPKPYLCSVPGCTRTSKNELAKTFGLPKDPERARLWMKQLGMENTEMSRRNITICDGHFEDGMINRENDMLTRLTPFAIPTLNRPPIDHESLSDVFLPSPTQHTVMEVEPPLAPSTMISEPHKTDNVQEPAQKKKKNMICEQPTTEGKANTKVPHNTVLKMVEVQKQMLAISKLPEAAKQLALKIYLIYPSAYQILHRSLYLPPVSALTTAFDGLPLSINTNILFLRCLQFKYANMTETQKDCVVCLGEMTIKPNVFYDIKHDRLIGVYDVNDVQKSEPARKALVLSVQGIYVNWQQAIAIGYIGHQKPKTLVAVKNWVERYIRCLLENGFRVHAFVSELETHLENDVKVVKPYFYVNKRKIYFIYDVKYLFKLFYYNMVKHDYSFNGVIAKITHLQDYYKLDSKKQSRLTPKLSKKHINPKSLEDLDIKDVTDVFSLSTAAAISTYIDFQALDKSAENTAHLITLMSKLLEILNCSRLDEKDNTPSRGKTQSRFISEMLDVFDTFKILGLHKNTNTSFLDNIKITLKSILMLYDDLKKRNLAFLPTNRLSLDNLRSYFDRFKKQRFGKPTCKDVNADFRKLAFLHLLRPLPKSKRITNLDIVLQNIQTITSDFKTIRPTLIDIVYAADIEIKCTDYNTLQFIGEKAIVMLAGFLLKKCSDRHGDCAAMRSYVSIVHHDSSSICKAILQEVQDGVCLVPQEELIEFVEMMEIRFRSFMNKEFINLKNGKFMNGLLHTMQPVNFPMPCACFPILYAKKLYLRIRVYQTLKYNNFRGLRDYLFVNNF